MAARADLEPLKNKLLAVMGPTGSGKSAFALEIARSIPSEIISCDSMAVYKGVDIGTDKVPPERREGVPHHLYDVAEAGGFFSAGMFRRMAEEAILKIRAAGRLPIIVGGTGLYARALLEGFSSAPSRDEALRERLKKRIASKGLSSLYGLLGRLDRQRASEIMPNDELRIVRALEVRILTGKSFSEVMKEGRVAGSPTSDTLKLCLSLPRPLLYARIDRRVDQMVSDGIAEEARRLWISGTLRGPVAKAIGYKELVPFFEGNRGLEESVDEIKKNSRNLAKRQLTWFRKENGLEWVRMDDEREKLAILAKVQKWYEGESHDGRS